MIVKCLCCGRSFEKLLSEINRSPRHFCSRSCAARVNNREHRKHLPIDRECKHCSATYRCANGYRSTRLCQTCQLIWKNRKRLTKETTLATLHKRTSLRRKHASWRNAHVRMLNRSWNISMTRNGCAVCGYQNHVELCHIRAITTFPEGAKLGDVNHPSNILPLCPNHHWEFDHGLLALNQVPH